MKNLLATVTLMGILMVGSFNASASIYVSNLNGGQPQPCSTGNDKTDLDWSIYVSNLGWSIYVSNLVKGMTGINTADTNDKNGTIVVGCGFSKAD